MTLNLHSHINLKSVTDYWEQRAESYSEHNVDELNSIKRELWKQVILGQAPQQDSSQPLKVLDLGTGPGFLAIIMAQAGHSVTAVDATKNMLQQAAQNAQKYGVVLDLIESDVQQLPFADNHFDLVISRNVTWNLQDPEKAYAEWYRVLKPNGRLINFDANWYLYLFNEEYHQGFVRDRQNSKTQQIADHWDYSYAKKMEQIAEELPLSRELRPQWDVNVLLKCGFSQFIINTKIGDKVWDQEEKINYASTPMFMLVALK